MREDLARRSRMKSSSRIKRRLRPDIVKILHPTDFAAASARAEAEAARLARGLDADALRQ